MYMHTTSLDIGKQAQLFQKRREQFSALLDKLPVVIHAGGRVARNYPANPYPFRASSHFLYLTGLSIPQAVLLLQDHTSVLFVEPAAEDDALWHGPTPSWAEWQQLSGVDRVCPLSELAAALQVLPRYGQLPFVRPLQMEDEQAARAMAQLRRVHDVAGIAEIRRALRVTHQAHLAGMRATKPGVTEAMVRAAMEHPIQAANFTTAYLSIVTVHGEILHNNDYTRQCKAGDLLLADVGAETDTGWASDITRTWPVTGTFSSTQLDLYNVVLQAQRHAISLVRPGQRYRDIHLAASRVLAQGLCDVGILQGQVDDLVERGAHALFFPHGIGHLLGLDVHDMEDLGEQRVAYAPGRARSSQFGLQYLRLDMDLQPGMTVTIEPGLYFVPAILNNPALIAPFQKDVRWDQLARFKDVRGIRIEDNVLVTKEGQEVLSAAIPKEPKDIEAIVQGTR